MVLTGKIVKQRVVTEGRLEIDFTKVIRVCVNLLVVIQTIINSMVLENCVMDVCGELADDAVID